MTDPQIGVQVAIFQAKRGNFQGIRALGPRNVNSRRAIRGNHRLPLSAWQTWVQFWSWWGKECRSRWSDRKSTRLNSSHHIISYAVFCLKKKKTCQNSKTNHTLHNPPYVCSDAAFMLSVPKNVQAIPKPSRANMCYHDATS